MKILHCGYGPLPHILLAFKKGYLSFIYCTCQIVPPLNSILKDQDNTSFFCVRHFSYTAVTFSQASLPGEAFSHIFSQPSKNKGKLSC